MTDEDDKVIEIDFGNVRVDSNKDIPPDQVLEQAKGRLKEVVVLGWAEDGSAFAASSSGQFAEVMLTIRMLEKFLIDSLVDDS